MQFCLVEWNWWGIPLVSLSSNPASLADIQAENTSDSSNTMDKNYNRKASCDDIDKITYSTFEIDSEPTGDKDLLEIFLHYIFHCYLTIFMHLNRLWSLCKSTLSLLWMQIEHRIERRLLSNHELPRVSYRWERRVGLRTILKYNKRGKEGETYRIEGAPGMEISGEWMEGVILSKREDEGGGRCHLNRWIVLSLSLSFYLCDTCLCQH